MSRRDSNGAPTYYKSPVSQPDQPETEHILFLYFYHERSSLNALFKKKSHTFLDVINDLLFSRLIT
jgi:hypothetical protein